MAAWMIPAAMAGAQIASNIYGANRAEKAQQRYMDQAEQANMAALSDIAGMEDLYLPDFSYMPQEYQYMPGYDPVPYAMPDEMAATTVQVDPQTRAIQMDALNEIIGRSEEGLSAADKYNFMKGRRAVDEAARGRELAIMENMRARGMSGSGLEASMRQQASQAAMDRLAESQAAQAASNAAQRLAATQAKANLAGGIRGQDIGLESTNADILNRFSQINSERANQIANMNIEAANKANQEKINEQRRIAEGNIAQQNQAQLQKQQYDYNRAMAENTAQRQKQQQMAGARKGQLPQMYAQGAAASGKEQHLYGTIGQAFPTAGNLYIDYLDAQNKKNRAPASTNDYFGSPSSPGIGAGSFEEAAIGGAAQGVKLKDPYGKYQY